MRVTDQLQFGFYDEFAEGQSRQSGNFRASFRAAQWTRNCIVGSPDFKANHSNILDRLDAKLPFLVHSTM
jgi:hypothetical protein